MLHIIDSFWQKLKQIQRIRKPANETYSRLIHQSIDERLHYILRYSQRLRKPFPDIQQMIHGHLLVPCGRLLGDVQDLQLRLSLSSNDNTSSSGLSIDLLALRLKVFTKFEDLKTSLRSFTSTSHSSESNSLRRFANELPNFDVFFGRSVPRHHLKLSDDDEDNEPQTSYRLNDKFFGSSFTPMKSKICLTRRRRHAFWNIAQHHKPQSQVARGSHRTYSLRQFEELSDEEVTLEIQKQYIDWNQQVAKTRESSKSNNLETSKLPFMCDLPYQRQLPKPPSPPPEEEQEHVVLNIEASKQLTSDPMNLKSPDPPIVTVSIPLTPMVGAAPPTSTSPILPSFQQTNSIAQTSNTTTEELVRRIYQHFNPSKLDDIPKLLDKYRQNEKQLITNLEKKYNFKTSALFGDKETPQNSSTSSSPVFSGLFNQNQIQSSQSFQDMNDSMQPSPFQSIPQSIPQSSIFSFPSSNPSPFQSPSPSSSSSSSLDELVASLTVVEMEMLVRSIYQRVKPDHLDKVPKILHKYQQHEKELLQKLEKQYNIRAIDFYVRPTSESKSSSIFSSPTTSSPQTSLFGRNPSVSGNGNLKSPLGIGAVSSWKPTTSIGSSLFNRN